MSAALNVNDRVLVLFYTPPRVGTIIRFSVREGSGPVVRIDGMKTPARFHPRFLQKVDDGPCAATG